MIELIFVFIFSKFHQEIIVEENPHRIIAQLYVQYIPG
jgi:hypothetical protein